MPSGDGGKLAGCFCASTAWFLLMFFVVLYPNVERASFTRGECAVAAATIASRYRCAVVDCDYCSLSFEPFCSTLASRYQALDPGRCETDAGQCAPSRVACSEGFKCCATTCDTCRSCRTVDGKTKCTTSSCNCRCGLSTPSNGCRLGCGVHYTVVVTASHAGGTGTFSTDFGTDHARAESYLHEWPIGRKFECFYKGAQIVLSVEYDTWRIVVFTLFGVLPLYVVSNVIVCLAFGDPVAGIVFWNGLVLPLCILLPIQQQGSVTPPVAAQLWAAVWIIFGLFFGAPLLLWFLAWTSRSCAAPSPSPPPSPERPRFSVPQAVPADLLVAEVVQTDSPAGAGATGTRDVETRERDEKVLTVM